MKNRLRVLVGCECSGKVREAFRALGHDAYSCDLLPAMDNSPYHYQCDVMQVLGYGWDMAIFHPECTYVCSSGLHWNGRTPGRAAKTDDAVAFVKSLWAAPIECIVIENPIGCLSTRFRKPTQIIQPHQFGDDASKATCLWMKNLPPLAPTCHVAPRTVNGKSRWANQTDSGQNKLTPSEDRWLLRSITYDGIANALASQLSVAALKHINQL